MVQQDNPNPNVIGTRLQTIVTAQGERIDRLSSQFDELSASMVSMRGLMESMFVTLQKLEGKRILVDPEGSPSSVILNDSSGPSSPKNTSSSSRPPPRALPPPPPDDPVFSLPRVQLPLFDGVDPRGWITKADLYFQVHRTIPEHRLPLVQMCMDKIALHWYSNLLAKYPDITWESFKNKLMVRFSGTNFRNPYEAIGSLFQDEFLDDYIDEFESLSALLSDQSEEQAIGMFLRGLKPDIRNWVRTLDPPTCDRAMEYARNIEVALGVHKGKAQSKPATFFSHIPKTLTLPNKPTLPPA